MCTLFRDIIFVVTGTTAITTTAAAVLIGIVNAVRKKVKDRVRKPQTRRQQGRTAHFNPAGGAIDVGQVAIGDDAVNGATEQKANVAARGVNVFSIVVVASTVVVPRVVVVVVQVAGGGVKEDRDAKKFAHPGRPRHVVVVQDGREQVETSRNAKQLVEGKGLLLVVAKERLAHAFRLQQRVEQV